MNFEPCERRNMERLLPDGRVQVVHHDARGAGPQRWGGWAPDGHVLEALAELGLAGAGAERGLLNARIHGDARFGRAASDGVGRERGRGLIVRRIGRDRGRLGRSSGVVVRRWGRRRRGPVCRAPHNRQEAARQSEGCGHSTHMTSVGSFISPRRHLSARQSYSAARVGPQNDMKNCQLPSTNLFPSC
jgi:hypothetical protein